MDHETLRILCDTAIDACRAELDGATAVNTDKMPGLLLGLIDAYTIGTSYVLNQQRHGNKPPKTESEA